MLSFFRNFLFSFYSLLSRFALPRLSAPWQSEDDGEWAVGWSKRQATLKSRRPQSPRRMEPTTSPPVPGLCPSLHSPAVSPTLPPDATSHDAICVSLLCSPSMYGECIWDVRQKKAGYEILYRVGLQIHSIYAHTQKEARRCTSERQLWVGTWKDAPHH